jgi:antitoxin HicB
MMSEKDLEYYMNLPYKIEVTPDEDGGFNASIPDLKGCVAFGETIEEVYQVITGVKQNWIEIALEKGWQIPEPIPEEIKEYSGRYVVRLPRYLHRKLAEIAETENTSLNQISVAFLAEGAERKYIQYEHKVLKSYADYLAAHFFDTYDTGGYYKDIFTEAANSKVYRTRIQYDQ